METMQLRAELFRAMNPMLDSDIMLRKMLAYVRSLFASQQLEQEEAQKKDNIISAKEHKNSLRSDSISCRFPCLLMLTEVCGCLAEMLFDIFAKEGGIGETEQVADLLNAVVSLLQVVTDVL